MLVDSHCHLDFPALKERLGDVLAAMQAAEVTHAVCVGVNLEDFPGILELVTGHANLFATVGVHPEYHDAVEPTVDELTALAAHAKVIAIGETGLDYYWHKDQPEWQRQRFRRHIQAAIASRKPLVVHTREAHEDTIDILRSEGQGSAVGVMHCFTGDWASACQYLELGFHISLSGIVTFKNAESVREVARRCPLDRLLVETDAPYLAPVPHRGKPNEPAYVRHVAGEIARLRDLPLEAVAQATSDNFFRLFNLPRN